MCCRRAVIVALVVAVPALAQERLDTTEYARRAALWLQTRQPLPIAQTMCVGCHVH
jgi:hypothetical protein